MRRGRQGEAARTRELEQRIAQFNADSRFVDPDIPEHMQRLPLKFQWTESVLPPDPSQSAIMIACIPNGAQAFLPPGPLSVVKNLKLRGLTLSGNPPAPDLLPGLDDLRAELNKKEFRGAIALDGLRLGLDSRGFVGALHGDCYYRVGYTPWRAGTLTHHSLGHGSVDIAVDRRETGVSVSCLLGFKVKRRSQVLAMPLYQKVVAICFRKNDVYALSAADAQDSL